MKNKKIIIILSAVLVIGCILFVFYQYFYGNNSWKIKVNDISKDCYSNTLLIYPNKDYVLVSATNQKVLAKGKSSYPNTVDYLKSEISKYPFDEEHYMNYGVSFDDGLHKNVGMEDSLELTKFIKTINGGNVFWCD